MTEKEKQLQKDYHITEEQFQRIYDVMDEAFKAIHENEDYDFIKFEHAILSIVQAPEGYPAYDHHMATAVARSFAEDERWEDVYLTLYKNVNSERAAIENWGKDPFKK